jgi:hypothetical protein
MCLIFLLCRRPVPDHRTAEINGSCPAVRAPPLVSLATDQQQQQSVTITAPLLFGCILFVYVKIDSALGYRINVLRFVKEILLVSCAVLFSGRRRKTAIFDLRID